MAQPTKQQLMAENKRLKVELNNYKSSKTQKSSFGRLLKQSLKWLVFALACALLVIANITFYIGRSAVETEKFMQIASPLIREPAIQEAIADKTTKAIYSQIDTEQLISSALPERAAILAPTLSTQLQKFTYDKSKEVLASEDFQQTYDKVVENSHKAFIGAIKNYEGDGTISVNDIYIGLSQRLQDSKLSFLADKQLPERIGTIQVFEADWLPAMHNLVVNLNNIRAGAIGLFLVLVGVFIWLSKNRRKAIIQLSMAVVLLGVATVLALNIAGSLAVENAKNYPEAAKAIWHVFTAPLIQQTIGAIALAAAIGLVTWAGGSSKTAKAVKKRLTALMSGKLHQGIFPKENAMTMWFGRNRKYLQLVIGVSFILSIASVDISWGSFISIGLLFLALSLAVELLAAKKSLKT